MLYLNRSLRLLVAFFSLCLPVYSADLKIQSSSESDVSQSVMFSLTGPIEKGDAAKLERLLDGLPGDVGSISLYMDSDGGSFAEALLLARLFNKRLVSTLVKREHHCLSACAIAFMGGAIEGPESVTLNSRAVEIGGKVGFHAPYLSVEQRQYNEKTVEYAYTKAVGSIADMIRLADEIGFSTDILPEILEKGPNDLKELVTSDDFARFGIDIVPVPKLTAVTRSMVQNACRNGYVWGATSRPEALRENLILNAAPEMKVYSRMSNYFSFEKLKVYRVVMDTAEGGEGTIDFKLLE